MQTIIKRTKRQHNIYEMDFVKQAVWERLRYGFLRSGITNLCCITYKPINNFFKIEKSFNIVEH